MVVPTPSEKSTIYKCVCRFSGTKDVKTRKDGEDDYWTCPGCKTEYGPVKPYPSPVIATEPETPSYIPNLSTDGQQKPCDARCGHDNHRIGCLNDPASEAACKCDCNSCRVRNRLTDRRKQRERAPSDPSPELRERIARVVCDARMKCGWPDNERLPRGFIDATDEQIADAILEKFVLSALGEPK